MSIIKQRWIKQWLLSIYAFIQSLFYKSVLSALSWPVKSTTRKCTFVAWCTYLVYISENPVSIFEKREWHWTNHSLVISFLFSTNNIKSQKCCQHTPMQLCRRAASSANSKLYPRIYKEELIIFLLSSLTLSAVKLLG